MWNAKTIGIALIVVYLCILLTIAIVKCNDD